jgi:hypothetical protein
LAGRSSLYGRLNTYIYGHACRACTRQEEEQGEGRIRLLPAGPKLPPQPASGGIRLGASRDVSPFGPGRRLHHDRELRGRDGRRCVPRCGGGCGRGGGRRGVHHHGEGHHLVPAVNAGNRGGGAVPVHGAVVGGGGGRVPGDAGGQVLGEEEQGDREGAERHPGHQGRRDGAGQGGAGVEEQGRCRHRRGGRVQGARQEVERQGHSPAPLPRFCFHRLLLGLRIREPHLAS